MKFINNTLYIKSNSKTMPCIYGDSELYQLLSENENIENFQTEFDTYFEKFGFTKKQILDFLTDYKQFEYTKENINKYIELLVFFKYKILNEFLEYILQFQLNVYYMNQNKKN